jgi:microcompartment protein CcmL/EutN
MTEAIGLIELTSIARGVETADTVLKAADVTLDFAKPVCPGKFILMVHGAVGAVERAIRAGVDQGRGAVIHHLVIPRVHASLLPALAGCVEPPAGVEALGVVEFFDITSAVIGADTAAKADQVTLVEVRLGMGIGGKSFFKLTGTVADVQSAVRAATQVAGERASLVSSCVIPNPAPALFRAML